MTDIRKLFQRILDDLDKEEKEELLEEMKNRKLTPDELLSAIKELDSDSKKAVREALADAKEEEKREEKKDDDKEEKKAERKIKTARKTRPGRKSGAAYDWWIDENGKVVRLDIARVYSGQDEPDEVEMFPDDEDNEDDESDAA